MPSIELVSGRASRLPWPYRWCIAALLLSSAVAVVAQGACGAPDTHDHAPDEVAYFGESVDSVDQPRSSAWGISYRRAFAPCFAASLAYLNDGHFPGHHRDGITGEVWVPFHLLSQHLTVSAGVGPFYYYDTTTANNSTGYADVHGWAWLYSADVIYQPWLARGLFFDLRLDHTAPSHSIETTSFGLGIGWRSISDFDKTHDADDVGQFRANELAAYYWKTVVNSFSSQTAPAAEIEYRRQIWDEIRASVGFLNEGDAQLVRRNGAVAEIWAEPSFNSGLWSIGVGAGGYAAIDKYRPSPGRHVSAIVSVTLSARPFAKWGLDRLDIRFLWHRIVTDYNRDTDIVLWGLGYRF